MVSGLWVDPRVLWMESVICGRNNHWETADKKDCGKSSIDATQITSSVWR